MTEKQEKIINQSVKMLTISEDEAGQRIDNYLLAKLKGVPKSLIYRILRKGEVRVNKGRIKPEYKLQNSDVVRVPPVRVSEKNTAPISKNLNKVASLESHILFEDDCLLVLNKPSGIAVHGGSGLNFGVIEALRALRPEARFLELVHRLDRDTSGILKVVQAPLLKNELASGERIVKVSEQGKPSETRFSIEERYQNATLVKASPVTGRTHQIRVHTQYAGHPIALDDKYGDKEFDKYMQDLGLNRLFLHAFSIRFEHPKTGETLRLNAQLDEKMKAILKKLRESKEINP